MGCKASGFVDVRRKAIGFGGSAHRSISSTPTKPTATRATFSVQFWRALCNAIHGLDGFHVMNSELLVLDFGFFVSGTEIPDSRFQSFIARIWIV